MKNVFLAGLLALGAVSCGGSGESLSCNDEVQRVCLTISFPVGVTLSKKTCTTATLVDSCAITGTIARCTSTTQVTISGTGVTQTNVARYYAGADLTAAEALCTTASGTWTTP